MWVVGSGFNRIIKYILSLMGSVLLMATALAQDKQLIQVKTFDEKLGFLPGIELLLNDKIEVTTNEKGTGFVEVSSVEIPFRSVYVKNPEVEVASWNLSKGTIEIIVRKKNYNLVTITIVDENELPLIRTEVSFTGLRQISVRTSGSGVIQLPLGLDERITSPNQFFVKGFQSVKLASVNNGYTLTVEKLAPIEAQRQVKPVGPTSRSTDGRMASLATAQTIREFYQIIRDLPLNELSESQKIKIDDKFNELLKSIQVTDTIQKVPLISDKDSLAITDEIKQLIERTASERSQLEVQRTEFDSRMDALDKKLSGGIANMDAVTREQLLKDIVSLEGLLLDNKRQFDKNQADYQLIISSIKERYFNIKILEEKLSVSEMLREKEQKEFRQQVIFAATALIIFLILIILLARFSDKMRKQQKALTLANNEIRKINESLEDRVARRTKLLQETNVELDTFLYRASHDLRTPVASIEGIASLANHLSREEFVHMIRASTGKMNNLLKNLRIISEINHPAEATTVSVGDLRVLIENTFRDMAEGNSVKLTWHGDDSAVIHTYAVFLESIIVKLLENAIFFTSLKNDSDPLISVAINKIDDFLELVVEDNGVGISESVRSRITEMFFRGHEKSKGSGLGLYIVVRCLRLMKGSILVESEEQQYTRVTVKIPNL
jgi:signal transduction histidine kinase